VIRVAQLLLLIAAGALWLASRLQWVVIESFDGLGQPKTSPVSGAMWSNALLPMAVLLLAAAVAGIAVRGWLLRAVALLIALLTLALGYLGVSLIVTPDVGPRGAELVGVSVISLVGSERHYAGAVLTLVAAVGALSAAVLLMRAASLGRSDTRYASPADRRAAVHSKVEPTVGMAQVSEREIWDALDEGRDPTEKRPEGVARNHSESDSEGR
jgi:uncharacterized membrane protein (TIGR02234 family)